jgi:hypothetical protein
MKLRIPLPTDKTEQKQISEQQIRLNKQQPLAKCFYSQVLAGRHKMGFSNLSFSKYIYAISGKNAKRANTEKWICPHDIQETQHSQNCNRLIYVAVITDLT